jgi:hypothetical protein
VAAEGVELIVPRGTDVCRHRAAGRSLIDSVRMAHAALSFAFGRTVCGALSRRLRGAPNTAVFVSEQQEAEHHTGGID